MPNDDAALPQNTNQDTQATTAISIPGLPDNHRSDTLKEFLAYALAIMSVATLKEFLAYALAIMSVAIYPVVIHNTAEANRKAGKHYPLGIQLRDMFSGTLVNLFLNKFASKEAIDSDISLYQQKKWGQLLTYTSVAFVCAAGGAFITYCDADGGLKWPSTIATEIGGGVLNALSLVQSKKFVDDHAIFFRLRRLFGKTTAAENQLFNMRSDVLENLLFMQAILRKSNIRHLNSHASSALQAIRELDGKVNPALNIPLPLHYIAKTFTFILSVIVSATLLFCILAYTCAADASFQKYLPGMKDSRMASMWLGIASMLAPVLFLTVIAGFSFVSRASDLLVTRIAYGRFPNDLTIGKGIVIAVISALITAVMAAYSGQTSADLLETCSASLMGAFMRVNAFTLNLAKISSSTFNWYFAVQAVFPLIGKLMGKCFPLNAYEKRYQAYQQQLNQLIKNAKDATTEEALQAIGGTEAPLDLNLTYPPSSFRSTLFAPRREEDNNNDSTVVGVSEEDTNDRDRLLSSNQSSKRFCCTML